MSNPDDSARRVVCAALKNSDGRIILGVRHFDQLMLRALEESPGDWSFAVQGFVDQKGNFLSREEALIVAVLQDQIIHKVGEERLYSENLY